MSNKKYKHLLPAEKVGVFLSLLCAIHCLTLPIILFVAPYLASSFAFSVTVEWILVVVSFGMALLLLWQDFRKHRKPMPLYFLGIGVFIKLVDTLVGLGTNPIIQRLQHKRGIYGDSTSLPSGRLLASQLKKSMVLIEGPAQPILHDLVEEEKKKEEFMKIKAAAEAQMRSMVPTLIKN